MDEYDGRQFVGIDLHRRRSVMVRQSESGEQLSAVRIVNDPVALGLQLEQAGADPEVVLEATYGWVRSEGVTVTGAGEGLKFNESGLVCGGVQTANATVYLVDTVMMPPAN